MREMRSINSLTCDPRLQMRERMDESTVESYAEAIRAKAARAKKSPWPFPPIQTVGAYVWDGWHRLEAAKRCGLKEVPVSDHAIKGSTKERRFDAALILACGANAYHGLKRTNAESRKAALTAIRLFPDKSLRQLADIANVSHMLIKKLKDQLNSEARGVNVYTSDPVAAQTHAVSGPNQSAEVDSRGPTVNVYTPSPPATATNAAASTIRATVLPDTQRVGGNELPPTASQADGRVDNAKAANANDRALSDATSSRLPSRPLIDSISDAMQTLGTLNKQIAACKAISHRDYNDCRFAMKTIDEILERWLDEVKAAEGVR